METKTRTRKLLTADLKKAVIRCFRELEEAYSHLVKKPNVYEKVAYIFATILFELKANMLTTPLSEEVLLDELLRHFPERIQSLWILEKNCTTTEAAEFLAAQEIPGQNPGEKTTIAPRESPRTSDHQLRKDTKRPRPNKDRNEVTRTEAPENRGNRFQNRTSGNQQWRNNKANFSNSRWYNNTTSSNNHWRKNNPNSTNNNTNSRAKGETSRNPKDSGNGAEYRAGPKVLRSATRPTKRQQGSTIENRRKTKTLDFVSLYGRKKRCSTASITGNNNKQKIVPEIEIQISQQQSVPALLNTGSEVSCISEEVWAKLIETGNKPPALP
ncbi:hypothetical protein TcasGA2_TC031583 [Tribolium castaneum]|uniref:Uncharacterized protein n=1 Tax=Tribolium castaneum TaxID=7070 RepID=A0A139WPM8_TRICA|nr:hypothetical protein TcasGA2_TC031583 [Tribolium castaneum]